MKTMNGTMKIVAGALMLTLAVLASCTKEAPAGTEPGGNESGEGCTLTVTLAGATTKATGVTAAQESAVTKFLLLVYNGAGTLEAESSVTSGSATVQVVAGQKTIIGLVNAPDLTAVQKASAASVKAVAHNLSDNAMGAFVMAGETTVAVVKNTEVDLTVTRFVSKVTVGKIAASFTEPTLRPLDFVLTGVSLINVAGDQDFGGTLASPTVWYNRRNWATSTVDGLTHDALSGVNLKDSGSHDTLHSFYCYPNPTAADSHASAWSPRWSRLLISGTLDGTPMVWLATIDMPIGRNKVYSVSDITITKPGYDPTNPEDMDEIEPSLTVSVSVADWGETVVVTPPEDF